MQFEFEGTEHAGSPVRGVVDATSANHAVEILTQRGVLLKAVRPLTGMTSPRVVATASVSPAPVAQRNVFRFKTYGAGDAQVTGVEHVTRAEHAASKLLDEGKTPWSLVDSAGREWIDQHSRASDRQLHVLFAQLGDLLRAGFTPFDALSKLAQNCPFPAVTQSLTHASHWAAEGGRISDVLALYPGIYPPGLVGMMRASELGGFLPEGTNLIAEQSMRQLKFLKHFWVVAFAVVNMVLTLPLGLAFPRAMTQAYRATEADTGGSALTVIAKTLFDMMLFTVLPITIAVFAILWLIARWLLHPKRLPLRHRLTLKLPVIGRRATHESVGTLCWTLAKLSARGISPRQSWIACSEAVPNFELRTRLLSVANGMADSMTLSQAVAKSKVVAPEYALMVQTGELTGEVSQVFDRLSAISDQSREHSELAAKGLGCSLAMNLMILAAGIVLIVVVYWWFKTLPAQVLEGLEP
ncbi:MAG: type II secretion system F family protein [Chthonomonas sp.]|nr:type II secretion system F family protein [Chthonomonas sp.]